MDGWMGTNLAVSYDVRQQTIFFYRERERVREISTTEASQPSCLALSTKYPKNRDNKRRAK